MPNSQTPPSQQTSLLVGTLAAAAFHFPAVLSVRSPSPTNGFETSKPSPTQPPAPAPLAIRAVPTWWRRPLESVTHVVVVVVTTAGFVGSFHCRGRRSGRVPCCLSVCFQEDRIDRDRPRVAELAGHQI